MVHAATLWTGRLRTPADLTSTTLWPASGTTPPRDSSSTSPVSPNPSRQVKQPQWYILPYWHSRIEPLKYYVKLPAYYRMLDHTIGLPHSRWTLQTGISMCVCVPVRPVASGAGPRSPPTTPPPPPPPNPRAGGSSVGSLSPVLTVDQSSLSLVEMSAEVTMWWL